MSTLIIGTGSYLPQRVVTNHDIEQMQTDYVPRPTGTLHDFVVAKHGAVTRHHLGPGETTSSMATEASRLALEDARVSASDIELIVLGTFSSDQRLPPAAAMIQAALGCSDAKYLQIDAGCSGFVDALLVANALLNAGVYRTALVIGADAVSVYNDPQRFIPLTIFGDGAGAIVLQRDDSVAARGILAIASGSDGARGHLVQIPGGGSKHPVSDEVVRDRSHYIQYDFTQIPKWGAHYMAHAAKRALQLAEIPLSDVNWIIPHQGAVNILQQVAQRLELPFDKFVMTYDRTGNTSAGSIPIALDQARRANMFADGDVLLLTSAGAGLAWGGAVCRWYERDHR